MANVTSRLSLLSLALLSVTLAGCASAAMRAGQQADMLKDYDRSIVEYTKVLREDPNNREAKQLLDVAKMRASLDHYARARRYEASGPTLHPAPGLAPARIHARPERSSRPRGR